MKYFPQGWNFFRFLITPDEMEQLLCGLHHVVFTKRVTADYVESPPEEYLIKYRNLYEKLGTGYRFEWKEDYPYFDLSIGLSEDLDKCAYGEPFADKRDGQHYKLSDFQEPCISLQPFILMIGEDEKLYSRVSYTQFPELTVGIELQYPKKICYFSENPIESGYSRIVPCGETETYELYQKLVKNVKTFTKTLNFQTEQGKSYRSGVWVSPQAKEDFKKFYFAAHYGISFLERRKRQ